MKKKCKNCGVLIIREKGVLSDKQWKLKKFCSHACFGPLISKVNKGNKYTVGYKHTKITRKRMSVSKMALEKREWFGSRNDYRNIHKRISRRFEKSTKCEDCGKDGLTGRKIHWANISHKYKEDRRDWKRLCAKCHAKFDKEFWLRNKNGRHY